MFTLVFSMSQIIRKINKYMQDITDQHNTKTSKPVILLKIWTGESENDSKNNDFIGEILQD